MHDYYQTSSVSNVLLRLNWNTMETHFKHLRLQMLHKIIHGSVDVSLPNYITLRTRHTRGSDLKATPNKFSVSRPGLKHICMRAGGSFPLFHYKIGSYYLPGTTIKSCIKACLSFSSCKNSANVKFVPTR